MNEPGRSSMTEGGRSGMTDAGRSGMTEAGRSGLTDAGRSAMLRLTLARACAWALLVAGWVGIGSLALLLAPSTSHAFALVALWLLALGAAATVATRGGSRTWLRSGALLGVAALSCAGLWLAVNGGSMPALLLALAGWAALTALASGVVRGLRLAQTAVATPPVAAAALGALGAGLVLGDPGDLRALALRLALFVAAAALLLVVLQSRLQAQRRAPGCRAGLFDCSLPAWPAGAWREPLNWPMLLAGLAMLPMMAALPLMADWCRAEAVAPQLMVMLHLAAMFGPALLLQRSIAGWSPRTLSIVCTALLASGAAWVVWAPAPLDLLGLAAAHGAAWGLAWAGQLWAPARRGAQGVSPLYAAAGYAVLTLAFGLVVEHFGARGVAATHLALAGVAMRAWLLHAALGSRARELGAAIPAQAAPPPEGQGLER